MKNYWVATTHSKGHKYSCCFSEFGDAEKWLNVVASCDNYHRPRGLTNFHDELRQNFQLKCFSFMNEAEAFRDKFLGGKNES